MAIAATVWFAWNRAESRRRTDECPNIQQLTATNPVVEADAAHARNDNHLIMLGGLAGEIPGRVDDRLPSRMLEGAGDVITQGCLRLKPAARAYATKYNERISFLASGKR